VPAPGISLVCRPRGRRRIGTCFHARPAKAGSRCTGATLRQVEAIGGSMEPRKKASRCGAAVFRACVALPGSAVDAGFTSGSTAEGQHRFRHCNGHDAGESHQRTAERDKANSGRLPALQGNRAEDDVGNESKNLGGEPAVH